MLQFIILNHKKPTHVKIARYEPLVLINFVTNVSVILATLNVRTSLLIVDSMKQIMILMYPISNLIIVEVYWYYGAVMSYLLNN